MAASMSGTCPTCGQEIPPHAFSVTGNSLVVGGRAIVLTPQQRTLLQALMDADTQGAEKDELINLLWPDGDRPKTAENIFHNQIGILRKQLAPDFEIRAQRQPQYRPNRWYLVETRQEYDGGN